MARTPPKRNPQNTSLTISLPKDLKSRIEEAAKEDRRPVSPWCVIQLEKILDEIDAKKIPPLLKVAEESGNQPSVHKVPAKSAGITYPAAKKPKLRSLKNPPSDERKAN